MYSFSTSAMILSRRNVYMFIFECFYMFYPSFYLDFCICSHVLDFSATNVIIYIPTYMPIYFSPKLMCPLPHSKNTIPMSKIYATPQPLSLNCSYIAHITPVTSCILSITFMISTYPSNESKWLMT